MNVRYLHSLDICVHRKFIQFTITNTYQYIELPFYIALVLWVLAQTLSFSSLNKGSCMN